MCKISRVDSTIFEQFSGIPVIVTSILRVNTDCFIDQIIRRFFWVMIRNIRPGVFVEFTGNDGESIDGEILYSDDNLKFFLLRMNYIPFEFYS